MSYFTKPIIKRVQPCVWALFVLITASCGSDDTPTTESVPTGPDEKAVLKSAGSVSIGDQSWQFAATTQCRAYNRDTVSIAGSAVSDSNVEIIFDVFDSDRATLQVRVGDKEWSGNADEFQVSVDDQSVSGTATVTDIMSRDSAAAVFEFNCR